MLNNFNLALLFHNQSCQTPHCSEVTHSVPNSQVSLFLLTFLISPLVCPHITTMPYCRPTLPPTIKPTLVSVVIIAELWYDGLPHGLENTTIGDEEQLSNLERTMCSPSTTRCSKGSDRAPYPKVCLSWRIIILLVPHCSQTLTFLVFPMKLVTMLHCTTIIYHAQTYKLPDHVGAYILPLLSW